MSTLSKRLAALEGINGAPGELVVVLRRFGEVGEYIRAKYPTGEMIERHPTETEEAFLKRACAEGVAATKAQMGRQPTYVIQPFRSA